MKLPDTLYDLLKWITMIVIPASATAYVGLAAVWDWPYADEIAKTAAVVCTLLGSLLGISTAQYNKAAQVEGKHVTVDTDSYEDVKKDLGYTGDDLWP